MAFSWREIFSPERAGRPTAPRASVRENDPKLLETFSQMNTIHFEGMLDVPCLRWNSRLRSSAGRFIPGKRTRPEDFPPVIELASYLKSEAEAEKHIADTMAHEMIHYWLWTRRQPYGHTADFYQKMKVIGVSRYNPVPRLRPFRFAYSCSGCGKEFYSKKKLGTLACSQCCKAHANGRFDSRFLLRLARTLSATEGTELAYKSAAIPR